MDVVDEELDELAHLTHGNDIDARIVRIIGRPMTSGNLGEYIAAKIFDLELESTVVTATIDGRVRSGPLAGNRQRQVGYLRREGLLDMSLANALDHYLVLTGTRSAATSSKGGTPPWHINAV
jgi:hypothetical protein